MCFFLAFLSLFNGFSFTVGLLLSGISNLLAFFGITKFLSVTFSDYEFTTVPTTNHNAFWTIIRFAFIFWCRVFGKHSCKCQPCNIKHGINIGRKFQSVST